MESTGGFVARFFGIDERWDRPLSRRRAWRPDLVIALAFAGLASLTLEITRSGGSLETLEVPVPWQYAWILLAAASLTLRRLFPEATLLFASLHLGISAWGFSEFMLVLGVQFYYFFALFSAIAWSRRRRLVSVTTVVFLGVMISWVISEFALRGRLDSLEAAPSFGPISPAWGAALAVLVSTVTFFSASAAAGSLTWWSARREARSRERALTIVEQSEALSQQAVGTERLRIARELHDVVGHHVAVMGIQTAAARTTMGTSADQAAAAMLVAEESARSATRDLRLILTALRDRDETDGTIGPQPDLSNLSEELAHFEQLGLTIDTTITGDTGRVPPTVEVAINRIILEAITNVHRHSTADRVELRLDVHETGTSSGHTTIVVRDNGRPKSGTSGSQVGLIGMRERALLHNGSLRTSTASDGGFEVTARLEWAE